MAPQPCPCGYKDDADFECRCTPDQIARYAMRVSGPFLDRVDLHVSVSRLSRQELACDAVSENSAVVKARVELAREFQLARQRYANSVLEGEALKRYCGLAKEEQALLDTAVDKLHLSMRATHRILKVARTIADLAGLDYIGATELVEAISYRKQI